MSVYFSNILRRMNIKRFDWLHTELCTHTHTHTHAERGGRVMWLKFYDLSCLCYTAY